MSSTMDVPNLNQRVHRISVEFYHQLTALGLVKKQTELIRGVIVNKMSKSPLHGITARRLFQKLLTLLGPGFTARFDEPLSLKDSVPEPDVSIVRGSDEDFADAHPKTAELVIEIAVTSLNDDRETAPIYAEAGVKEYWIVIPERKQVETFRQPENGQYREQRTYAEQDTLTCASVPGISLPVASIFSAPAK